MYKRYSTVYAADRPCMYYRTSYHFRILSAQPRRDAVYRLSQFLNTGAPRLSDSTSNSAYIASVPAVARHDVLLSARVPVVMQRTASHIVA